MRPGLCSIFNHKPGGRRKHPYSTHHRTDQSQHVSLDPCESLTNLFCLPCLWCHCVHPLSPLMGYILSSRCRRSSRSLRHRTILA